MATTSTFCRTPCARFPSPPFSSSSSPPPMQLRRRLSSKTAALLATIGAGLTVATTSAQALPTDALALAFQEPQNALSLPTWAIHVSSVVEWVTAMVLVWEYGEKSGFQRWKGLSWGMVPSLGGALCACTWHFFYNSESLELDSHNSSGILYMMQLDNRIANGTLSYQLLKDQLNSNYFSFWSIFLFPA